MQSIVAARSPSSATLLLIGVWFGIVTGLVEGFGLLLFQKINWERWGAVIHVSAPIFWIAVVVDVLLFGVVALGFMGAARLFPRIAAARGLAVVLTGLAVYDWLMVSERLKVRACALLAIGVAVALGRWLKKHETGAVQFWKRSLPWLAAVAVLIFAVVEGSSWLKERRALANLPPAKPGAPNVLVIVVDTLRADRLSSYGYSRPTSPNIDRLAGEGVLFENAVSASSWTFPSHVSLVTGRYPFEHGLGNIPPVPLFGAGNSGLGGYPTLGEALERAGYRTAAFSGNRSYFTAQLGFWRGFSHFDDLYHSLGDRFARTFYGREMLRLYVKWFDKRLMVEASQYGRNYVVRKTGDQINDEVLSWVDRSRERPFFAFLNYFDVHDPYGGPQALPEQAWDPDAYDKGVAMVDACIGRLTQALEERGLLENTLLIITSDHGESLNEHGMKGHGKTLFWSLIHVPLVVVYPGHIPAGERVKRPVSNVAIAATVADLIGTAKPEIFEGPSLSELWKSPGKGDTWPSPVSELSQNKFLVIEDPVADRTYPTGKAGAMRSLVWDRWHLIIHKSLGNQLYDRVSDPAESRNLINTPEGQETLQAMLPQLDHLLAASGGGEPSTTAMDLAEDAPERNGTRTVAGIGKGGIAFYRVRADAGTKLLVRVVAQKNASGRRFDPTLAIENAAGEIYRTCNNPGDDNIPKPGVADATPQLMDDVCMNDDVRPGADSDAELEIEVPGREGSSTELYFRVGSWKGNIGADLRYQIIVGNAAQSAQDRFPEQPARQ